MIVTITEQASNKIKEMLTQQDSSKSLYLRVAVKEGGCSGFSYGLGFDDQKRDEDMEYEMHGIKVLIDNNSYPYLNGAIVDYKESLMGGGFMINNPNATASCGCGSSFRTATAAGKPSEC